jgi:signal transduction histidine kinase/ActR/RegA family two-component response regulator
LLFSLAKESMISAAEPVVASVDEVLITSELNGRPVRQPDYAAESQALVALANVMAESPQSVFQKLAEVALELCQAGSAGISVWEPNSTPDIFRWRATAGEYTPYLGGTMPRCFSPCGTVLDRNAPLLMADPERFFPYISELCAPVREVLLVPFYQGEKAIGTVWVVAHTADKHFDAEDARLVTSLTKFAGAAVLVLNRTEAAERAERAQRASEERHRALVTASSDVVYRMSADWEVMQPLDGRGLIASNSAAIRGWLQKNLPEFEHARVREAIAKAIAGKATFEMEHQVIRVDGTLGWTFSRAVPLLDEKREILEWFGAASDITFRKQAEEALKEADRKKDDFIALLAHELRNPLAPIRNGLQVMRLAADNKAAVAQSREIMERQLSHMVRLIDDLLDVSRVSRNKMELRREQVSLANVIHTAVETVQPLLDAAGHELHVSLPHREVILDADLTRLAQVFGNLLTNSAKYTPKGGQVWVAARRQSEEVVVSVRDTGIGIPPTSLRSIFDMFSQVDRSVERSTGGLGIGLALVKGLVEMHGGKVRAESEGEGKGSTFVVTLPALPDRLIANHDAIDTPHKGNRPRRILIADDNRDGAESLALMMELLGNEVQSVTDGLQAVQTAELFRPDVILMDVGMPRLNGLEATKKIREQSWGQGITIVALTGWGQDSDRVLSSEAGCNGHLLKPVSIADLKELLHNQVDD